MAKIPSTLTTRRVLKLDPINVEAQWECLDADVTPSRGFFVRNHSTIPDLRETHRLRVHGAVDRALDFGMEDLRNLESREVVATLECAGNGRGRMMPRPPGEPWGLGAVSTARWRGVPLRAVLERAGVRDGTVEILAVGADRGVPQEGRIEIPFARSLPLAKAMDPDTILALEMNGTPLPLEHGAPVRLVVTGWYGVASVKWVARLEALTQPFAGYYQGRRYVFASGDQADPLQTMRVRALILSPSEEAVRAGDVPVRGRAWSGDGAIVRVEISVDEGPWREARLLPAISRHAWRAWEFDWEDARPGSHTLKARATDAGGNSQPDVARWNELGYGNNSVHIVSVQVE